MILTVIGPSKFGEKLQTMQRKIDDVKRSSGNSLWMSKRHHHSRYYEQTNRRGYHCDMQVDMISIEEISGVHITGS